MTGHERPPLRDVVRVIYVRGMRGGRQVALVHIDGEIMS